MWHGPLRTNSPPTRVNDDLLLNHRYWNILCTHQENFVGKKFQHSAIQGGSNDVQSQFVAKFLKKGFVYLITETVGDYPYPYFSEKTWKAIVSKVPFMLVGSPGSLSKLQEFGFKTFDQWWKEEYDLLPTVSQRIESIVLELKSLSTLSLLELEQLRKEMLPIINHNYNHLSTFISNDLANVREKL
jgi:hypothetical protein